MGESASHKSAEKQSPRKSPFDYNFYLLMEQFNTANGHHANTTTTKSFIVINEIFLCKLRCVVSCFALGENVNNQVDSRLYTIMDNSNLKTGDGSNNFEHDVLRGSFRLSENNSDLSNFDFESDLRKYLKMKAKFLRSLVHDCGVRNDEKPCIIESVEKLRISDCPDKSNDLAVHEANPVDYDSSFADSSLEVREEPIIADVDDTVTILGDRISHDFSNTTQPEQNNVEEHDSTLYVIDEAFNEMTDMSPKNLHRKVYRWNKIRYSGELEGQPENLDAAKEKPIEYSESLFHEDILKAFVAGRLLFWALRMRWQPFDSKREKIADSLFQEEPKADLIDFVDPSSLIGDARPMIAITSTTLQQDRLFLKAQKHPKQVPISKKENNTGNLTVVEETGLKSKVDLAPSKLISKELPPKNRSKEIKIKPTKRCSSSSDDDLEELERLSEARLGRRY